MKRIDSVKYSITKINQHPNGEELLFSLDIPMDVGWIDSCVLVIEDDYGIKRVPMSFLENRDSFVCFDASVFLEQRANYRYYFEYFVLGEKYYITNHETKKSIEYDEKNKLSVMFSVPDWAKGAVMYHIFLDRFYRESNDRPKEMERRQIHNDWKEDVVLGDNPNILKHYPEEQVWNVDYFGGDFQGIIQKLDYLNFLGVTILYLSPVPKSQSNHRYDATNYYEVDPYLGKTEDLKKLCEEAHKKGMKVLLDAVFNHVGDESIYFDRYGEYRGNNSYENGAFQNPNSKYYSMFRYYHGNNTYWYQFPTLPELNCDSEEWRKYFCGEGGVIDFWFSLGIDGLRLDVADSLSDAALEQIHNAAIRNKEDALIIGEVWDDPFKKGRSYISSGKSMHTTMNYQLVDALVRYFKYQDLSKLSYILRDIQAYYPTEMIPTLMNFTSTHDISRPITLFGKKEFDPDGKFSELDGYFQSKLYEAFWEMGYSNEDVASLLAGKMEMNYYEYQQLMQILSHKGLESHTLTYLQSIFHFTPFDNDQEYAKDLPEDIKQNLEYTRRYLLTEEEYKRAKDVYQAYLLFLATYPGIFSIFYGDEAGMQGLNNLANRRPFPWGDEDTDLVTYFQQLGNFRKSYPFLRDADFHLIDLSSDNVLFERVGKDRSILVAINNSDQEKKILLPEEYQDGQKVLTLKKSKKDSLNPYGGVIIEK